VFKKRAEIIEKALKPLGVEVIINAEKPRKGAFVVTVEKVVTHINNPSCYNVTLCF
jgi:predicted HAD superfamily phosphohydrolase YqeG